MDAYRSPFRRPGEDRRPALAWAREIPIDDSPADVEDVVTANMTWMAQSRTPKLFINGEPGALLTGPLRDTCRGWPHQEEITVPGLHFLPEDSPDHSSRTVVDFRSWPSLHHDRSTPKVVAQPRDRES